MKKLFSIVLFLMLALAACGTEKEKIDNSTQGTDNTQQTIILYKSDADAVHTMPFEVPFEGNEGNLIPFIFSKVNEYDLELLDYTLEDNDTGLALNLGGNVYTIQGSTGAGMFVETLARSYFENLKDLQQITFIYEGSYESILDHMKIGEPYTRQDFDL